MSRRRPGALVALLTAALLLAPAGRAAADPARDLARLCDDYWQGWLRAHPMDATTIGDRRYDDRLEDISPAGLTRERQRLEAVVARARAIPENALASRDRLTRAALILEAQKHVDEILCGLGDWMVDPSAGPQVDFMGLADYTVIATPADADHYVARARAMGPYVDQHIANLRAGLAAGKVANRIAVEKTLEDLDSLLAHPAADWPLVVPARELRPTWSAAEHDRFFERLTVATRETVIPAFGRYRDFLRAQILPAARPPERAGMSFLPGGTEAYRRLIHTQTSLVRTPEELHALGLEEVARVRAELSTLGGTVLGTTDVAEIQRRLRTDPAMQFSTSAEVENKARATLARAKAAIPGYFGLLPRADCQVKVISAFEAPHTTIAYYREPAADGSRPGYYMINSYAPTTRPRYEAEALAFHESIPGHHLQIAIAQELTGLPEFRRHQGVTAFVEGWGLYSERLADEMGLYSGGLDRIGLLSFDAWRACRLVVDTGLHALGWSRQQAIDYMMANTVLAENNVVNEVDRYLGDPGQALAYKLGQLEILALRDEARAKLGDRFDLKRFHDAVLENGAVALPVLRERIEAWIASEGGTP